jgi:hypothetical protein
LKNRAPGNDGDELRPRKPFHFRAERNDSIRNDLRNRIDWSASPQNDLLHHTPFIAIVVKSGNRTTWAGAEPNEMVVEYVRQHNAAIGATTQATRKNHENSN